MHSLESAEAFSVHSRVEDIVIGNDDITSLFLGHASAPYNLKRRACRKARINGFFSDFNRSMVRSPAEGVGAAGRGDDRLV
jgi:hypothetical protein